MIEIQHVEVPRHQWSEFCHDFGRRNRGRGVEVSTSHGNGVRRVVVAEASLERLRLIRGRDGYSPIAASSGDHAPELRVRVGVDEERGGIEFAVPVQLRLFGLVSGAGAPSGLRVEVNRGGVCLDLRLVEARAASAG